MNEVLLPRSGWRKGLSFRLLLVTLAAVLLVEALIYLPGIAGFRNAWLGERLTQARTLATLIETSPPESLPRAVIEDVLASAGISTIALRIENTRRLIASVETPRMVSYEIDLRRENILRDIIGTFDVLLRGDARTLRVIGTPPRGGDFVEIVLNEGPLRTALERFSWAILRDSLLISVLAALIVYAALSWLIVIPMRRLAHVVTRFGKTPADARTQLSDTRREDELGELERNIAQMQLSLRNELRQREHLAQLGLAVAKINHDLRNMLASAQLMADRIGASPDPNVQRFVPRLLDALDRAIHFCQSALTFGRAEERPPKLEPVELESLFRDIGAQMLLDSGTTPALLVRVPAGLRALADYEQLARVMTNLVRNARAALDGAERASPEPACIALEARAAQGEAGPEVEIAVQDNGNGVPEGVRARIFQAFAGSARAGGTGLGLAIVQDLVKAMGGQMRLETPPGGGARFVFTLPAA